MINNTNKSFLPAIIGTIRRSADTVAEGADAIKDLLTDSEAVEQIPVFSAAVKILNIRDIFMQQRLERNCRSFLAAVEGADLDKVEEMRLRLESDPDYLGDFTDTVMSVLIEGQKPIKGQLIGKLVMALSTEAITLEEFQSLSQIVQAALAPALTALKVFIDRNGGKLYLSGHGLIQEEPLLISIGLGSRFGNMFRVSELGGKLYVHGFDGSVAT